MVEVIEREITPQLLRRFGEYPIVTVTGPRQAGKTTLCRGTFPELPYANLEEPDTRELAVADPRRFLGQFPDGAVLDEVHHAPDLLSYLQVLVDNHERYAELSFFRTADGLECDLLYPTPAGLAAVEIKSGTTLTGSWFAGLRRAERSIPGVATTSIVYGGTETRVRNDATAVPLDGFAELLAAFDALTPLPALEQGDVDGVDL